MWARRQVGLCALCVVLSFFYHIQLRLVSVPVPTALRVKIIRD